MKPTKLVKRRQISNACIACRKAHRACDVQRPCKRCQSKGLECSTVHSQTVDEIFGAVAREMQTDGFVFDEPSDQNYIFSEYNDINGASDGSPSDLAPENNLQYSNNCELHAAALQRITSIENELQQLRDIIKNAMQPHPQNSLIVSSKIGHAKWNLDTRRIIGCNDRFHEIVGVTRQDLPIFEQWMSSGLYPKVKFVLEKIDAGARLVEVKAAYKHPTTQQERCIFLQFTRDVSDPTIISTNVVPLDHYDNEFRVDDYTQFPTISRQCFAVATEGNAIPWQCCCPDEHGQFDHFQQQRLMETIPKEEYVPITKTDYGYVQKVTYVQPDLYHEEVVEIESPFASVVATGTQVYTFLLMGDQNAGKSTFIHAFTYQADPNYLELSTLLPILSSSFFNTRFLDPGSKADPRDELPFLDTDIGRGTVLVTRDDFAFWLDENGLPVEDYPRDTRFIALQFIEIGGDHLDSMMTPKSVSPSLKDVVNRSLQLVHQAKKTIYFVNLKTLLQIHDNEITLHKISYDKLIGRLSFLSGLFKEKHGILFSLSRVPLDRDLNINCNEISKQVGFNVPASKATDVKQKLVDLIDSLLTHEHKARNWSFDVVDVYSSCHLDEDQNLDVASILGTLVKLLSNDMIHSKTEPEMIVARHVINCFKNSHARVNEADEFSLWIDEEVFHEYLEEGIDVPEVPETVMLQKLPIVAKRMEETNLALIHYGNNFSKFGIHFDVNGTKYTWRSVTNNNQVVQKLELRLPYFGPLFNVIDNYFTKNIPAEFWLHKEPLKKSQDVELAKHLNDALAQLEVEIDKKWSEMLNGMQILKETSQVETDPRMIMWLLLIDEWLMGQRLLFVDEDKDVKMREWKFSRQLQLGNANEWDRVMKLFHIHLLSHNDTSNSIDTVLINIAYAG